MKSLSLLILIFLSLAILSCQREDVQHSGKLITINATQQNSPDLKTNIGAPGTLTVTWNETDKLAVFDGTGSNRNVQFSCSAGSGTQSGTFTGTINGWESGSKTFYAVYPYNIANAGSSISTYPISIPQTQTQDFTSEATKYAHLGILDYLAAPAVTVEKTGETQPEINFSFQHLMAILDIEVTNNTGGLVTVTQIKIKRSSQDFTLAATLDLTKSLDALGFYNKGTATEQLVLALQNASQIGNIGTLTSSIIIAPADLTSGITDFEVTVLNAENQQVVYTITKSSGKSFEAGKRYLAKITLGNPIPTFTDSRDGKVYKMVTIGTQSWMMDNLAFLPAVNPSIDGAEFGSCYYVYGYEGTSVSEAKSHINYNTYGVLYNFPAAKVACPTGWYLPSDAEWTILTDYLTNNGYGYGGLGPDIGKSMAAPSSWLLYPTVGFVGNDNVSNNRSGFNILPGGWRHNTGFTSINMYTLFWSSTDTPGSFAWSLNLSYDQDKPERWNSSTNWGFYVRCIKE